MSTVAVRGSSERSRRALVEAAAAWPSFRVEPNAYCLRFDELTETSGGDALEINPADLYLALGCLARDANAEQALNRLLTAELKHLSHFRLSQDEQVALAREAKRLLLEGGDGPPKLSQYAARGSLVSWLHVLLSRVALNAAQRARRELPSDADVLLGLRDGVERHGAHRRRFAESFRAGLQLLTPRQRNLLRQHFLDDLSLEDLGAMYRVHRSVSAQWLIAAREELLNRTRHEVKLRAELPEPDVNGVMGLIRDRLDLSASYFLSTRIPLNDGQGVESR